MRLGLVFSEDPVSGSDFTNRRKSRARILKHGSRRLGESRILPFYTPNLVSNYKSERWANYCIRSNLERKWLNGKSKPDSTKKVFPYNVCLPSWMIKLRACIIVIGCLHTQSCHIRRYFLYISLTKFMRD